jgi:aerobic-type carbon monoxide dehydrogenase small subunit (CoxS/CutS family)
MTTAFTVNGQPRRLELDPATLLLEALREHLRLTGTKCGCDDSSCGACTVLVNGQPALACTLLAASCDGADINTIEGIAADGRLTALQRAFGRMGGAQCGFCTPGMVMAAKALLDGNPDPSDGEIHAALSGNICRCTGYVQILASVRAALAEAADAAAAGAAQPEAAAAAGRRGSGPAQRRQAAEPPAAHG